MENKHFKVMNIILDLNSGEKIHLTYLVGLTHIERTVWVVGGVFMRLCAGRGLLMDASSKMTVPEEVELMEAEIERVVTKLTRISKVEGTLCKVDDHIYCNPSDQSLNICFCCCNKLLVALKDLSN